MISMNKFWDIVKESNWKKVYKNNNIDYNYYKNINRKRFSNCDEIQNEIIILTSVLKERVLDFFKRRKYGMKYYELKNKMALSDDIF